MKRLFSRGIPGSGRLLAALFTLSVALPSRTLAADLVTETFNTNGEGSRYTSSTYVNGSDAFTRTDLYPYTSHAGPLTATPPQSAGYWATEDIDSTGNPLGNHGIVRLNSINVTGLNNLQVHVYFAQVADKFDLNDKIEVQAAFDGNRGGATLTSGNFTTIGRFIGDTVDQFGDGPMRQDVNLINLDGQVTDDGGSPVLSDTMTEYTFDIPAQGAWLSVQVRFEQNGGNEHLAFDHLRVTAPVAIEPFKIVFVEHSSTGVEVTFNTTPANSTASSMWTARPATRLAGRLSLTRWPG